MIERREEETCLRDQPLSLSLGRRDRAFVFLMISRKEEQINGARRQT